MSGALSPREHHQAFWARQHRCPTIEALQRDFAGEAQLHGAAKATIDALLYSLRERGLAALAEPDTQRRLADLSPAQIADSITRIVKWRDHYPDADDLLVAFAGILE